MSVASGWLGRWSVALGLTAGLVSARAATNSFGFAGPEIFPLDQQVSHLRAADLNGDGLNDLIVVNNGRSRITVLLNQTGKPPRTRPTGGRDINELPPDARFAIDSIASEKRISDLAVADLNGDQQPDLAYYGEPKELVVQYNQGTNGWSMPKRWAIEDGQTALNTLSTGDLNGDGRTDLVLLGDSHLYLLAQKADHQLAEPEKIPFSGMVKSVQVLDIDGDGRQDLLLVNWDSPNPVRFRLQDPAGHLGPEIHFTLPPIRAFHAEDLNGDKRTEMVTIAQNSGRAELAAFQRKAAEKLTGNFQVGQFQTLPLNKTSKARRGLAWADVNGDGRPDLLVAEPDSGQLTIHLQSAGGEITTGRTFPTLTGVSEISVADWDGDGRNEIFLLSADERQVGVTRWDEGGRVAFPTLVPLEGKPLALAVGALEPGTPPVLALLVDQDGRRSLVLRPAKGPARTQKLAESFKANPTSLTFHDVNQDGAMDLLVLIEYEKVRVLLQEKGRDFRELEVAPPGGNQDKPWLSVADVDGDGRSELLLAQKNFVRAVVLKPDDEKDPGRGWSFQVKDQINGAGSNSRLVGAAALRAGEGRVPTLFLFDVERKVLSVCERDAAGVWQIVRNLPLPFAEFSALQPVAMGTGAPDTVAFLGQNAVAWLPLRGQVWETKQLDGYETPVKDGRLNDVICGDLNQDGRADLVFLETVRNYLDLVMLNADSKFVPCNRWQVFEERTFRNRRSEMPEPREAVITDLTGDGKKDMAVLVHDRILVYPQE
jgi:hypothetical protein